MPALVERAANLWWLKAREKGLDLQVEIDPRRPAQVLTDANRLKQVIFNQLSQRHQVTDAGSVRIRYGLARRTDPGHRGDRTPAAAWTRP